VTQLSSPRSMKEVKTREDKLQAAWIAHDRRAARRRKYLRGWFTVAELVPPNVKRLLRGVVVDE
jgi:hypothetical protein